MDVFDAIRTRRSVRSYKPDAIPEDVMARMLSALRFAPSACNFQPWRFIVVTVPAKRDAVARACHEQMFMAEAPAIIAGCGFPDEAYKHMGGKGSSVDVDVSIALDHLTLAAAAEGLGTCWIGAFDEAAVKSVLGIPTNVKVVALTPLGYPADASALNPAGSERRKPIDEIISYDKF